MSNEKKKTFRAIIAKFRKLVGTTYLKKANVDFKLFNAKSHLRAFGRVTYLERALLTESLSLPDF